MKSNTKKQKGFTLIELLVVISITGLLSSVILVSLKGARENAKIARAKLDVEAIQKGLILYYEDNGNFNGADFRCGGVDTNPNNGGYGNNICDQAGWNSGWFRPYVSNVPLDPWGNPYFFDGIPVSGFENDPSDCGHWGTAVYSSGPNKVIDGVNGPGPAGDDIALFFDSPSVCN